MTDPVETGPSSHSRITQLLIDLGGGDAQALNHLYPLVLDELKRIASNHLRKERPGHTLNTTALVHESYLKLVDGSTATCGNRSQFFAIASRAMRQLLIDHARQRNAQKRGGDYRQVTLDPNLVATPSRAVDLIALDQAMERLGKIDARLEKVVERRVFGGMKVQEIADSLDVSRRTVERDWERARAYLYRDLAPGGGTGADEADEEGTSATP
jgi:RNA polymerase sigma factor (TIGR02999 family)